MGSNEISSTEVIDRTHRGRVSPIADLGQGPRKLVLTQFQGIQLHQQVHLQVFVGM